MISAFTRSAKPNVPEPSTQALSGLVLPIIEPAVAALARQLVPAILAAGVLAGIVTGLLIGAWLMIGGD
jgi:uncharacterized membrane protein YraQ (UPF0718 family)